MTTTTISDIFTPPVPPPHVPRCEPSMIRCAQGVQRHLPHTGNGWLFAGIAFAACVVGYALLRISRPRQRFIVTRTLSDRPWAVVDTTSGAVRVSYMRKAAAKHRAMVLNADVPSLADSKGWKA